MQRKENNIFFETVYFPGFFLGGIFFKLGRFWKNSLKVSCKRVTSFNFSFGNFRIKKLNDYFVGKRL